MQAVITFLLWFVFSVIVFIATVFIAALVLPLRIWVNGCGEAQLDGRYMGLHGSYTFEASVMGGTFRFTTGHRRPSVIFLFGIKIREIGRGTGKFKPARQRMSKRARKLKLIRPDCLEPAVIKHVFKFARIIIGLINVNASVRVEYGFEDPATTGMMTSVFALMSHLIKGITAIPNFEKELYNLRGSFEIKLVPVRLILPCISFFLSREIRPLWLVRFKEFIVPARQGLAKE